MNVWEDAQVCIMWVIFITMVCFVMVHGSKVTETSQNGSEAIIYNLRRQLMIDNYDYSSEDNKHSTKRIKIDKESRRNFYVSDLINNNATYISNVTYSEDKDADNDKTPYNDVTKSEWMESTAKYTVLKVRTQYRRNNQAHLIQEESNDGVAIVNLDPGPIPELRLPDTRRQYKQDQGELLPDEEEVPPPPVDTSDPEAAAE